MLCRGQRFCCVFSEPIKVNGCWPLLIKQQQLFDRYGYLVGGQGEKLMPSRINGTGNKFTIPESRQSEPSGKMNDRVVTQEAGVSRQAVYEPGEHPIRQLVSYIIGRADTPELVARLKEHFTQDVYEMKKMQLEVAGELLAARYPDSKWLQDSLVKEVAKSQRVQFGSYVKHLRYGDGPLEKKTIKQLRNHQETILNTIAKNGFEISKKAFKEALVKKLGKVEWSTITSQFTLGHGAAKLNARQNCIPAGKIGYDLLSDAYQGHDIFSRSYKNKSVVAHSIKRKNHATNMFVSEFNLEVASGIEKLTIVRHGINSAYGLKKNEVRDAAAINRAKEMITASLAAQPDKFARAVDGERVSLTVTSSSLLTPDLFRKVINPLGDEKAMLEDQQNAFNVLKSQSPLTLSVKDKNGQQKTITVDLNLIPFNFGVNKFALGTKWLESLWGWEMSDVLNREGIEQLVGDPKSENDVTGIVGQWLEEHPDDDNAILVQALGRQIKEIFNAGGHHLLSGGAYKLPARIIVLTSLIGAVPCTNCKSGKDRTSVAVAAAEALFTYLQMNHTVPDWRTLGVAESELVKALCLNGGHHEIQRLNTGVGGFKIQPEILRAYHMSAEDIALIRGLSDSVSS